VEVSVVPSALDQSPLIWCHSRLTVFPGGAAKRTPVATAALTRFILAVRSLVLRFLPRPLPNGCRRISPTISSRAAGFDALPVLSRFRQKQFNSSGNRLIDVCRLNGGEILIGKVRPLLFFVVLLCPALAFAQNHSVTLSWTPAQQSSGITISSWNVLRGTANGGPYTQLANVPAGTTSYTDSSVSSGQNYYYVVQAVDSAGATSVDSIQAEAIIPTSPPPLAVATTSLPAATVGASYSVTLTATGGTAPYTWSGTGVDGLTFSATGLLSGKTTQAGPFTQSVTVKESTGATASASLALTVASTSGGGTSITLIQHTSKDAGTTSSSTLTFASNNTASNWIAVSIRAGAANENFTVTDTNRNTYRKAIQFNLTVDGDTIGIFYAENIAGGTNTVTVSDTGLATLRFAILEYSGVATSGSLDVVAVTQGNSASPNSGSVMTTANGDLLLGAIITADPETYTAGIGYRIEEGVPAEPGTKLITEDQVQAAAGAAAASATLGMANPWAAGIAAFKSGR
jgi:hypothetical protein